MIKDRSYVGPRGFNLWWLSQPKKGNQEVSAEVNHTDPRISFSKLLKRLLRSVSTTVVYETISQSSSRVARTVLNRR
jgi:hypothetical protein